MQNHNPTTERHSDRTGIEQFPIGGGHGWVFFDPDETPDAWIQTDTTEAVEP